MSKEPVWFVYDGECPVCRLGVNFYALSQAVGQIQTVDARTEPNHQVMLEIKAAGLDLDEGMVLKYRDRLYHGDEALHKMAELGAQSGVLNRINNTLFRFKRLAKLCYPAMKLARNFALKCKGVGKINNLKP